MKPSYFYIDSGNKDLDRAYIRIVHESTKAGYKLPALRVVSEIRDLINHFTHYEEYIKERLVFDLSEYVDNLSEKIESKDKSNRVVQNRLKELNATKNILEWVQGGMVDFIFEESPLMKDESSNEFIDCFADYFEHYKDEKVISVKDYERLKNHLMEYFAKKSSKFEKPVFIKSGNTKRIAFSLNQLWMSQTTEKLSYEYLLFCKSLINLFENVTLDSANFTHCTLYKYFKTKSL